MDRPDRPLTERKRFRHPILTADLGFAQPSAVSCLDHGRTAMPQISIDARPSAWPHDGRLEASETALLIIDMQRDFRAEGGYIASMGYDVCPARKIIPNVRRVRDAVAAWGGLIVLTREGHRPD
jgi:Isochorismatase family